MNKIYTVELDTTTNNKSIEPFSMYLSYGYDKEKALSVAKNLSEFFPYVEYPTTINVYQEEENEKGFLKNKKTIYTQMLADEEGFLLVKVFDNKEEALKHWEKHYSLYIHDVYEIDHNNFLLKIMSKNEFDKRLTANEDLDPCYHDDELGNSNCL